MAQASSPTPAPRRPLNYVRLLLAAFIAMSVVFVSPTVVTADDRAEANRLVVEAVKAYQRAHASDDPAVKSEALNSALAALQKIIDDYPGADHAVTLISGGEIAGISIPLLRGALREAELAPAGPDTMPQTESYDDRVPEIGLAILYQQSDVGPVISVVTSTDGKKVEYFNASQGQYQRDVWRAICNSSYATGSDWWQRTTYRQGCDTVFPVTPGNEYRMTGNIVDSDGTSEVAAWHFVAAAGELHPVFGETLSFSGLTYVAGPTSATLKHQEVVISIDHGIITQMSSTSNLTNLEGGWSTRAVDYIQLSSTWMQEHLYNCTTAAMTRSGIARCFCAMKSFEGSLSPNDATLAEALFADPDISGAGYNELRRRGRRWLRDHAGHCTPS